MALRSPSPHSFPDSCTSGMTPSPHSILLASTSPAPGLSPLHNLLLTMARYPMSRSILHLPNPQHPQPQVPRTCNPLLLPTGIGTASLLPLHTCARRRTMTATTSPTCCMIWIRRVRGMRRCCSHQGNRRMFDCRTTSRCVELSIFLHLY